MLVMAQRQVAGVSHIFLGKPGCNTKRLDGPAYGGRELLEGTAATRMTCAFEV